MFRRQVPSLSGMFPATRAGKRIAPGESMQTVDKKFFSPRRGRKVSSNSLDRRKSGAYPESKRCLCPQTASFHKRCKSLTKRFSPPRRGRKDSSNSLYRRKSGAYPESKRCLCPQTASFHKPSMLFSYFANISVAIRKHLPAILCASPENTPEEKARNSVEHQE